MSVPFATNHAIDRAVSGGYVLGEYYPALLIDDQDLGAIAWQSGTTVRYSFGAQDLSGVVIGDTLIAYDCTYTANRGSFTITAVSDVSNYVEISNPLRTSATGNEADSPGSASIVSATGSASVTIRANVQSMTEWRHADKNLLSALGAEFVDGMIKIYSEDAIYTAIKSPNKQPDRLAYEGQNYEVKYASKYDFGNVSHYRGVACLIDEKTE